MRLRNLFLLSLVFLGCSATKPSDYSGRAAYAKSIADKYALGIYPVEAYTNKFARNQLLNELILLVNDRYSEYERGFYSNNAFANTASDLVILGLSSAATVAGGDGVKTALAATITGISGAKMAVSKEFFAEQSRIALISKMRAIRLVKLSEIEENKKRPITDYPLSKALLDIQEFAESGTLVSGLQGLVEQSSSSLSSARALYFKSKELFHS